MPPAQKASDTGLFAVRGTLLQSLLQGIFHKPNDTPQSKFQSKIPSSFLVSCSIFKTTSHQFAGRRPNGMLTRGTRARTQTMSKKIPSSFKFIILPLVLVCNEDVICMRLQHPLVLVCNEDVICMRLQRINIIP
jgi:hypothetical protein